MRTQRRRMVSSFFIGPLEDLTQSFLWQPWLFRCGTGAVHSAPDVSRALWVPKRAHAAASHQLHFRNLWSGWGEPPLAQDLPCGGPLPGGALPSAPLPLSHRITCAPDRAPCCEQAKSLVKEHLGRMTCDCAQTKTAQQHQPDHPQSSCHACKEDECTIQGECDHLSDIPATRNDVSSCF